MLANKKKDILIKRPPIKVKMDLYKIEKKRLLVNKLKKRKIEALD